MKSTDFAIYYRDEAGILSRPGYVVNSDRLDFDPTEIGDLERLKGWPDRSVWWVDNTGYAPYRN